MRFKNIVAGFLLINSLYSFAQNNSKDILFKIDETPYYTDEFVRIYKKNLDLVKDESQKDLNQYLDLFVGYKLKVNKASKLLLDQNPDYISELKSYRNQLSKKYLTDNNVTNELIEEAYQRSLKEVDASHILIMVGEDAIPADTLKAYNKIMDIRKKAIAAEASFADLANKYSEDRYGDEGVQNGGNLGYFSVFRMIYPFESAAYKTPVGKVSMPIRTKFGYHIVKVNNVRDNRGSIAVAHIMILKETEGKKDPKAKKRIDEVHAKILQGENFEELAKQFSEDKSSANKGGKLHPFSSGELSSEILEEAAFALSKENPISAPIETDYGFHIVKFIENIPAKPLEEVRSEYEGKIKRDERSQLIVKSVNDHLKKKYKITTNDKTLIAANKEVNDDYYVGKWKVPANSKLLANTLLTIRNKKILVEDYFKFIESNQSIIRDIKPIKNLTAKLYEKFVESQLMNYHNDNLEAEYSEFAEAMTEYKDGLLLFNLMDQEIWEKAKNDSIGLQNFYQKNSHNYQWKNRYDLTILSSTNKDIIKKASKYLKQKKSIDFIKEKLNENGKINIIEKVGVFEEDQITLPKNNTLKVGNNEVFSEGDYYYAVFVNKLLPAGAKQLEECRGKVINDFQQYLEDHLVSELKNEFKIEIDSKVFESVKKSMQ